MPEMYFARLYRPPHAGELDGGGRARLSSRGVLASSCAEGDRHVLDAADEVRAEHLRLARQLHVRDAFEDLAEDEVQLHASEVRTQAVVRAAAAESHVLVRVAIDVERVRVVEDFLVAV